MREYQPVQRVRVDVLDAFMALDCESQLACKKAASIRHQQMRRGIEVHFENKQLRKNLKQYDFD
ncbi:MAG: hypothetical protein ACI9W6_001424 [Motiliproteus sp.]|jgi:hypothetical protein